MSKGGNFNDRIEKEINSLVKNPDDEFGIYKVFDDRRNFYAYIKGPSESPFENGYYKLFIHLKEDYPFAAPVVKFMTKVFHPNISSQTGAICLDVLKDKWTAACNLTTTLLSISALLTAAVPEDPQDHSVAIIYIDDREKYNRIAKEWNDKYAKKDIVTDNEKLIEECSKLYNESFVANTASRNIWVKERLLQTLEAETKKM